jgi:hypothetical protein
VEKVECPLRAFIKQKQRPPEKLFSEQRSATDWARGANTSARRRIGAAKLIKSPRNTLPASKSGVLVLSPTATGEFQPHLKEFGFRPVHFERLLRRVFILIQLQGFGILVKFFRHKDQHGMTGSVVPRGVVRGFLDALEVAEDPPKMVTGCGRVTKTGQSKDDSYVGMRWI